MEIQRRDSEVCKVDEENKQLLRQFDIFKNENNEREQQLLQQITTLQQQISNSSNNSSTSSSQILQGSSVSRKMSHAHVESLKTPPQRKNSSSSLAANSPSYSPSSASSAKEFNSDSSSAKPKSSKSGWNLFSFVQESIQILQNTNSTSKDADDDNNSSQQQSGNGGMNYGSSKSSSSSSASSYSTPRLEEFKKQKQIKVVQAHNEAINCIAINHQYSIMATGSTDKTVKLWDPHTCMMHSQLPAAGASIVKMSFSRSNEADYLLTGSLDHHARLYSVSQGKLLNAFKCDKWVYGCDFVDHTRILTGGHDSQIKLWDINTTQCIKSFTITSSCNDLEMTTCGDKASVHYNTNLFASAHSDQSVKFWDVRTGESVKSLDKLHEQSVTSINFSQQDGHYLLTNSRDDSMHIIDMRTFKKILTLSDSKYKNGMLNNKARFSPNGTCVCGGSSLGVLVIWDISNMSSVQSYATERVHLDLIAGVVWTSDTSVASCSKDSKFVIY